MWAKKAAEAGLVKAMYAVGYFLEVGIGTEPNMTECVRSLLLFGSSKPSHRASMWYKKAAEQGDKRAIARLKGHGPISTPGGAGAVLHRNSGDDASSGSGKGGKDKDCIIM